MGEDAEGERNPGVETGTGPEGGEVDGGNMLQSDSEFRVRVSLHNRGCRWPDNASEKERQAWTTAFWVSIHHVSSQGVACAVLGPVGDAGVSGSLGTTATWLPHLLFCT